MGYAKYKKETVTITSGNTASSAADCGNMALVGIQFPATVTGATVGVTYCGTSDGTFIDVVNSSGVAISYTASDGDVVSVDAADLLFAGSGFIKLVSASAEAADREITLIFKTVG